jgi:hypothetical protein
MQGPLPDLPEDEGCKVLDGMIKQCEIYWAEQRKTGGI